MATKRYFIRPSGKHSSLYNVYDSRYSSYGKTTIIVEYVEKAEAERRRDELNAQQGVKEAQEQARKVRLDAFNNSLTKEESAQWRQAVEAVSYRESILPSAAERLIEDMDRLINTLLYYVKNLRNMTDQTKEQITNPNYTQKGDIALDAARAVAREVKFLQQGLGLEDIFTEAVRTNDAQQKADSLHERYVQTYNEQPKVTMERFAERQRAFYEEYDQTHPISAA